MYIHVYVPVHVLHLLCVQLCSYFGSNHLKFRYSTPSQLCRVILSPRLNMPGTAMGNLVLYLPRHCRMAATMIASGARSAMADIGSCL